MTQEQIKNNSIIAEFMGFIFYDDEGKYYHVEEGYFLCIPNELKYHESWDWLMPVVERIESLGNKVSISEAYCDIYSHRCISFCDIGGGDYTKLSATYEAVLQFIKFHQHPNTENA